MFALGVVLAAGAGQRMGRPKALVETADGTSWLAAALGVLRASGCDQVAAVIGAAAEQVRALPLPPGVDLVTAPTWELGIGESLHAALDHAETTEARQLILHLVDTPDVTADVVTRVLTATLPDQDDGLARAWFNGAPGHPVVLGRAHWAAVRAATGGPRGAGPWLAGQQVRAVECGDLASGWDVDDPAGLAAWTRKGGHS